MYITNLNIKNLRNHSDTDIEFCNGVNIITGQNGVGKTTILEALYICCFSKSFQPTPEKELIKKNEDSYNLILNAKSDFDSNYKINVSFKSGDKKRFNGSLGENLLPKDIIGEIPIVVLNPDYKNITFGAPQNRRDFIDKVLSQTNKLYFENLIRLKKAIRQKNNLLFLSKKDRYFDFGQVDIWSDLILELSTEIISKRFDFISIFQNYFLETYSEVSHNREEVNLCYTPNGIQNNLDKPSKDIINQSLKVYQSKVRLDEFKRGVTLVGPHKDDIKIKINGGVAKDYASQGQHKSLLISLKFSEFHFLKDKHNETPVLLLDDVFAELDNQRSDLVLNLIKSNKVQTFITTTEVEKFHQFQNDSIETKIFKIENGKLIINN